MKPTGSTSLRHTTWRIRQGFWRSVLAGVLALALFLPHPAYDQHNQELAVGNGAASSKFSSRDVPRSGASSGRSHALRKQQAKDSPTATAGLEGALKERAASRELRAAGLEEEERHVADSEWRIGEPFAGREAAAGLESKGPEQWIELLKKWQGFSTEVRFVLMKFHGAGWERRIEEHTRRSAILPLSRALKHYPNIEGIIIGGDLEHAVEEIELSLEAFKEALYWVEEIVSDSKLSDEQKEFRLMLDSAAEPAGKPLGEWTEYYRDRIKELVQRSTEWNQELKQMIQPPQAGLEAIRATSDERRVTRFNSVGAFLAKHGEQLSEQGLFTTAQEFPERGAVQVLVLPDGKMTESVIAYALPFKWVEPVEEHLKSSPFVLAAPYPADGRVEPRSVVIQQAGLESARPRPAVPVLVFRSLEEMQARLTPELVYSAAILLKDTELGIVIGVLTFKDALGRTLHALFV